MANRFTNVATSQFDPMSLQEIMTVPLAKQKAHDEMMAQTQQAQVMDSARVSKDDEVVAAELDRLRGRATELSDMMLESGLTRGAKNRFSELRSDTQRAMSSEGVLGRAKATFDKVQANIKTINENKNLSQQQKQAGINWAMQNYAGVEQGGVYQDYVGADYLDINEKARNIAKEISPQEIADVTGYEYDPMTKTYSKGGMSTTRLTPEEISQAVYQSMINDDGVAAYLQDATKIGLISDPQGFLQAASQNAGNIYAVNNYDVSSKVLPKHAQGQIIDDNGAWMNTQGYRQRDGYLKSSVEQTAREMVDPENASEFDDQGNWIGDIQKKASFDHGQNPVVSNPSAMVSTSYMNRVNQSAHATAEEVEAYNKKRERLNTWKANNGWENVPDKVAATLMNQFTQKANAAFSKVYYNQNQESTLNVMKDILLGTSGDIGGEAGKGIQKAGEILERRIYDNNTGKVYSTVGEYADDIGIDVNELLARMKAGNSPGISPGHQFPMGLAMSFIGDEGQNMSVTVENSPDIAKTFNETSKLVNNMKSGIQFETEVDVDPITGQREYRTYVLDVKSDTNPQTGYPENFSWVPRVITTLHPVENKEEALDIARNVRQDDPNVRVESLDQVTASNMRDLTEIYGQVSQHKNK